MNASLTENESVRLQALRQFNVLDTLPEQAFDDLTYLASFICGAPISLVTLIDEDRQWFKSRVGLDVAETPRDQAFCAHAIHQPDIFIVKDALKDERFADNPLVTSEPHIRFYAGAPLVTSDGHALGTLCVIDRVPRDLTPDQAHALEALSRQVMAQLEIRRTAQSLESANASLELEIAERERAEQKLREQAELLELAHDAIIVRDINSVITFWNQGAEQTYGYARSEAIGQMTHTFLDTHFPVSLEEINDALLREGKWEGELTHRRSDGGRIIVASRHVLQRDLRGEPTAILEINRDITRRKEAEEYLRKTEQYRNLFQHATDAIIVFEPREGTILDVNERACELYSLPPGDFIGRSFRQLFSRLEQDESYGEALLRGGVVREFEAVHRRADGSTFNVMVSSSMVEYQGSRAVLSLQHDITERVRAEEGLRAALKEVERLKNQLQSDNVYLREEILSDHNFGEIIGSSHSLKDVMRKVRQVAATDTTVLIVGETGTGKELMARAIHNSSLRKGRPMIKVNCATLPANLIESELFGHEKGAFTGAVASRVGRFELANGATIFLDEIGELPLDLQAKLLRVLQEGEFERLGSSRTIKVDVRVIAATNRDLEAASRNGTFRSDLYYRLHVFPINVPPLRERKEDIPLLVSTFIQRENKRLGKTIEAVPRETMEALQNYPWPGNIRELQSVIERAAIITQGSKLQLADDLTRRSNDASTEMKEQP
ncbi:MAG: sigma 54-interacting transcriptional regulator, partial [Pyrinomonadaceae bacterium]|nr:sigma 54-interacting transcriptional regulator [Pyrinomonadaceae bacterium]